MSQGRYVINVMLVYFIDKVNDLYDIVENKYIYMMCVHISKIKEERNKANFPVFSRFFFYLSFVLLVAALTHKIDEQAMMREQTEKTLLLEILCFFFAN